MYDYSLLTISLFSITIVCVSIEIGWQLKVHGRGWRGDNIYTLENAILGILALMIAFTFAMALSRFEARRDSVVKEANAIGTTALRARLLPEPHRTETLKLLRDYVQIRLDAIQSGRSLAEWTASIERSNMLQEALWLQTKAMAVKDNGVVPTGLFIQALNEMIDSQGIRLAALRNRMPNIVSLGLYAITMIACAFAGYASALDAKRSRVGPYLMGLLVCGVIYMILDLDRPNSGFITTDQQPMIDTAASIASY